MQVDRGHFPILRFGSQPLDYSPHFLSPPSLFFFSWEGFEEEYKGGGEGKEGERKKRNREREGKRGEGREEGRRKKRKKGEGGKSLGEGGKAFLFYKSVGSGVPPKIFLHFSVGFSQWVCSPLPNF